MYAFCELLPFVCPFFFLRLVLYDCTKSNILRETYVSSMEKSIQALIKSVRVIDGKFVTIEEDLEELLYDHLPFLENISKKKKSTISATFNPFKNQIKAIFPGTYWCGEGNISSNESDLGFFEKTDACCKFHDLCPNNILAEEDQHGLLNNGIFTRKVSSCECDGDFYRCLKQANNIMASNIGTMYFNVLRPQCFQKYYPIQSCGKYSRRRLINNKCEEYVYNVTRPEIMQWFDNPDF